MKSFTTDKLTGFIEKIRKKLTVFFTKSAAKQYIYDKLSDDILDNIIAKLLGTDVKDFAYREEVSLFVNETLPKFIDHLKEPTLSFELQLMNRLAFEKLLRTLSFPQPNYKLKCREHLKNVDGSNVSTLIDTLRQSPIYHLSPHENLENLFTST